MNKPKNTQKPYKYALYDLLFKKYGTDYIHGKQLMAKEVGMSLPTVHKDFGVKRNEKRKIPRSRLIVYAMHFGVNENDLVIKSAVKKANTSKVK